MIALSTREELAELERCLGSQAAVARVMGRDPSIVSRWMSAPTRRLNRASCAAVGAAYVVVNALLSQESTEIEHVLTSPWPALDGHAPCELIARGKSEPILEAIIAHNRSETIEQPQTNDALTELRATVSAEPMELDARLTGFYGYQPATGERVGLTVQPGPALPDPNGTVRGITYQEPIGW